MSPSRNQYLTAGGQDSDKIGLSWQHRSCDRCVLIWITTLKKNTSVALPVQTASKEKNFVHLKGNVLTV